MNNRTRVAVERQITAMGADVFEVGLFKPRVPGDSSNEPEMLPRVWDKETLLRSVSWLSYQNANGRNVYVRPKGEHHLSLVDDLTAAAVQKMKNEGFTPALVVETSPGNFQAWLNHGQVLQKQLSTLAADLGRRFGGDKEPPIMAPEIGGLTNENLSTARGRPLPFVHLVRQRQSYRAAENLLQELSAQLAEQQRIQRSVPHTVDAGKSRLTIDDFRAKPAYGGDGNRIDLAYTVYALTHGVSEADIRSAIASRDLSKKGPEQRQLNYIERTIRSLLPLEGEPCTQLKF